MNSSETRYKPPVEITFPREIQISKKVWATFVPFEHNLKSMEEHKVVIEAAAKQCDFLMLEYLPLELQKIPTPLTNMIFEIDEIIDYYAEIEKMAIIFKKPLLRLDPANNVEWDLVFRMPLRLASLPLLLGSFEATFGAITQQPQTILHAAPLFFSGSILYLASEIPLSYGISHEVMKGKLSKMPNENMFRRANIVQKLITLGEKVDNNPDQPALNIGVFYPPLHCEGMFDNFQHPGKREKVMNFFSPLKLIPPLKKSFFTGYQYDWNGTTQNWKGKVAISI